MSKKKNTPKIKDMAKVERPREKLIQYGPEKLNNSELLAILMRSGPKGQNVVKFAESILKRYGSSRLPHLSVTELLEFNGIGKAKACEIVACFELGKRILKGKRTVLCMSPKEVWMELKGIRNKKKEYFVAFYLDTRNKMIRRETVSMGTLNASLVHPREVFEPAVKNNAAHLITAHNHPSGDVKPSKEDIELTQRLVKAGEILGIELLDHVIVATEKYFSFKEKGLI